MGRKRWWGGIVCLCAIMVVSGVARSASYPETGGTINDSAFDFISIDDDADRTFTSGITIKGRGVDLSGTGTTTFDSTLTIQDSSGGTTGNASADTGIYITNGTNIFQGNVSSGYLASEEAGGNNTFEGKVTLWDEDRDPGDNEPLTGYAIGLGGGTFLFKDDVEITQSGKHAAFINSTSTFEKHLNAGTGDVEIGISGRVADIMEDYGASWPAGSSKIILNGAGAEITAANINIYDKGTLDVRSAATINGAVRVNQGGMITTATDANLAINGGFLGFTNGSGTFGGTVDTSGGALDIDGDSRVTFEKDVTVGHFEIMNDIRASKAPVTAFNGNVTATYLAIDARFNSTNTFNGNVTLNGYDDDIPDINGKNTSLVIADGTNTFGGNVDTGNKNAIFAKSTSTFNGNLLAGSGDLQIGYNAVLQGFEGGSDPENPPVGFYNSQPAKVILNGTGNTAAKVDIFENGFLQLGSGSSLTATSGINIANKGTLALTGNAAATGDLTFKSGSTFAIDAKYKLTVSGATDIQTGAVANVQNVDSIEAVGKTILTSTGGITGQFGASGLYKVEAAGTDLKITGLNRVEDVLAENNIVTGNSIAAGAMTSSILSGATTATPELRLNLNNAIGNITALAATNPGLAKAATAQLFGEHGVTGVTASQTTAQNFSGSVGNHQTQLRDNSQASAAPASANSTSAYASFRTTRRSASSFNPNRIWGGGFGAWTRQDDKDNQSGYKYNSGGFILGYDREFGVSPTGSFVAGFSAAYSAGEIANNDGFTTTDVDTFNVGVYASYNHNSGFFADVNAGFGFSWNDVDTADIIAGGHKTGEYDTTSFQLGGTVGYAVTLPQEFRFIPSVGLQFNHVNQDAWSERTQNATQIAHSFEESNSNSLSIPVQVRLNKTFHLGNGASVTPEVRGAWIYEAKNPQAQVRMGYVGSNASTTLYGMDVGRSRGLVGAGVKMKFGKADAFVDYNYEFRSGYDNHNVMAGLGLLF